VKTDRSPASELETVAVVGGGAAGALVAIHLLRSNAPVRIVMIERGERVTRGVAYGTGFPAHLLNVVAANMGGLAENPNHFREWLAIEHQPVRPTAFMPRMIYGDYLRQLLHETVEAAPAGGFELVHAEVVGIAPVAAGYRLELTGGGGLDADRVVIATGVLPPRDAPLRAGAWPADSPRYVRDPWAAGALAGLAPGNDVLLVGTGLTMIDVALQIADERPEVRLTAISRSGLLPRPHRPPGERHPIDFMPPRSGTPLKQLPALLRAATLKADAVGGDWRDVVNSMRPYTQGIWKGMSRDDQRRFLVRFARYWDIHRHRMAPAVAASIAGLRDHGQLDIRGGRFQSVEADGAGLTVTVAARGSGEIATLRVDAAVNCTGPAGSVVGAGSRLLDDLCARGLARPHPLGLGLDTGDDGALRAADGTVSSTLFTIGWLRRGELWESVAIPEIRSQAADIARRFAPPE
jgi:uncharacterized NAD(P)/FAD-binding protein YdhS